MAPSPQQAVAALHLIMCLEKRRRARQAKKRLWMRSWLARREKESVYHRLLRELSLEDHETLKNWTRLDHKQYQELLQLVEPLISKTDTRMRRAVTAGERLTLTLRYLATGQSQYLSVFAIFSPRGSQGIWVIFTEAGAR